MTLPQSHCRHRRSRSSRSANLLVSGGDLQRLFLQKHLSQRRRFFPQRQHLRPQNGILMFQNGRPQRNLIFSHLPRVSRFLRGLIVPSPALEILFVFLFVRYWFLLASLSTKVRIVEGRTWGGGVCSRIYEHYNVMVWFERIK